jgi:predicted RNase H-like nuclease
LVEVYPHPALMTLTGANYRLPYKVSRSRRYWPGSTPAERRTNLIAQFRDILYALKNEIVGIHLEPPSATGAISTSGLTRYEDSADALFCAWVGAKYLEGAAVPYGNHTAAPRVWRHH